MPTHKDLSGQVIKGIQILAVDHVDSNRREYFYRCRCHCGSKHIFSNSSLRNPKVKSCGCLSRHGRTSTPEYRTWAAMKARCFNPNVVAYPNYGGRGIIVCERWLSFKNFFADMGKKPASHYMIERIDNNGSYTPDNCRWASIQDQTRNRRNNVLLNLHGRSLCLQDWAQRLGVSPDTLKARLNRGWSIKKTLTVPIRKHKPYSWARTNTVPGK